MQITYSPDLGEVQEYFLGATMAESATIVHHVCVCACVLLAAGHLERYGGSLRRVHTKEKPAGVILFVCLCPVFVPVCVCAGHLQSRPW